MVGVAFNVDHLRRDVFRLVAECVNDDSATDRAVRASGTSLRGASDFQFTGLGVRGSEIEAEDGGDCSAGADLQERSASRGHRSLLGRIVSLNNERGTVSTHKMHAERKRVSIF